VTLDVPRISNTWVSFPGHFDTRAIFDNEISIPFLRYAIYYNTISEKSYECNELTQIEIYYIAQFFSISA